MEPFAVITPTGDRPEAFALCVKWMKSQDLSPHVWVVVDDGEADRRVQDWLDPLAQSSGPSS